MTAADRSGGLEADVRLRRGALDLRLPLTVRPGETVALLGPNGAGKTTTLRALAGLLPLEAGSVRLGAHVLDEPATGVFVPASLRRVAMVFQDHLLFPHLDVLENVAFGLRARGTGRRQARERARAWCQRVGVSELVGARPGQLSGGQAQRAALARALATDPALLLLDEPLAALDAGTRLQVRSELGRHLEALEASTVLVTHDALDAMVLADRLVVVEAGRVVQVGTPAEVARAPRTQYVAQLVGLNLYRGTAGGGVLLLSSGGELRTADAVPTGPVLVAFPPSAVALHGRPPEGSPRNAWEGVVSGLEQHGSTVRVRLDGRPPVLADVTPQAVADLGLAVGRRVWAAVKATEVHAYPA